MRRWIQKLVVVLATGYILFFYSERVFWSFLRPGHKSLDFVLGWLVYSLLAWIFLLLVRQCRVASFPAVFLAGGRLRLVGRGSGGRYSLRQRRWLISPNWASLARPYGRPRLDDPFDWVRLEIVAALGRYIPMVPLLVGGAAMPLATQLPPELQPLADLKPIKLGHIRFNEEIQDLFKRLELLAGKTMSRSKKSVVTTQRKAHHSESKDIALNRTRLPLGSRTSSFFLNYQSEDTGGYSIRIFERLVEHFGRRMVFRDTYDDIPPDGHLPAKMVRRLGACRALVVVIGPHWADLMRAGGVPLAHDRLDPVRLEVIAAVERGIPTIPMLVGGAQVPLAKDLPEPLAWISTPPFPLTKAGV